MRKLLRLVIVASLPIITACAVAPKQMYDGPRLKPELEAVLVGDIGSRGGHVYITGVNEKSTLDLPALMATQMYPYPRGVFVLPGRHQISVKFVRDKGSPRVVDGRLQIDAEAGKIYFIYATASEFWIEHSSTGDAAERNNPSKSPH